MRASVTATSVSPSAPVIAVRRIKPECGKTFGRGSRQQFPVPLSGHPMG
jgi:hypothetical protein